MIKSFFKIAIVVFGSFGISVALFVSIPISNYFNLKKAELYEKEELPIHAVQKKVKLQKKKPPPKRNRPKPSSNKKLSSTLKLNRTKLSMDLSHQAANGMGIGSANLSEGLIGDEGSQGLIYPSIIRPVAMPKYPDKARDAGISGLVVCEIEVDISGNISNWEIIDSPGNYGFREEIALALKDWKFTPGSLNGIPVSMKVRQPFEF